MPRTLQRCTNKYVRGARARREAGLTGFPIVRRNREADFTGTIGPAAARGISGRHVGCFSESAASPHATTYTEREDLFMTTRTRMTGTIAALALALITASGCSLGRLLDALDGPYYHISAGNGVYITLQRHATECMVWAFNNCKSSGKSDSICGRDVLRTSRGIIEKSLGGTALDIWLGNYSIAGYHPRLKNGWEDDEADDFATAVYDLASRTDECLRLHWKPTGENWTTIDDEGFAECDWGSYVAVPGTPLHCTATGIR